MEISGVTAKCHCWPNLAKFQLLVNSCKPLERITCVEFDRKGWNYDEDWVATNKVKMTKKRVAPEKLKPEWKASSDLLECRTP